MKIHSTKKTQNMNSHSEQLGNILKAELFTNNNNNNNKLIYKKSALKTEADTSMKQSINKPEKAVVNLQNIANKKTRNHNPTNKRGIDNESIKYFTKSIKQALKNKNKTDDNNDEGNRMASNNVNHVSLSKLSAKGNNKNNKDKSVKNFEENQLNHFKVLEKFYEKERILNKKYSLFDFPDTNDVEKCGSKNAQIPVEYFNDFLDTYCREENSLEFKIIPNFMDNQLEINPRMRAIVVDWLIEVHDRFKLLPDTLFLTVIIFDRYMSAVHSIKKGRLQLIGVTSLLVACKYEEIFSPEVRDFVCILDRAFEAEDLMNQENDMMKVLRFELTFPTSLRYFEILTKIFNIEEKLFPYGKFLLELTLLDCRFSKYSQAVIATTVTFMIEKLFYGVNIGKFLENYIKITEQEIKECLIDICFLFENIEDSIYPALTKKHRKVFNSLKLKLKIE